MATGFGFSTGDFIAGINLVRDVIKALQDSKGSSKEYLELVAELRTLETALLEVKALDLQIEQRDQRTALRKAIKECQTCIDNFLKDLTKYSRHLRLGGSRCTWKDAYRKIQWQLCKKDDLVRFRDEIGLHVQSIQVLMLSIQIHSTSLHTESLRNQFAELNDQRDVLQDILAAMKNAQGSFENHLEEIRRHGSMQQRAIADIHRTGQANLLKCFQMLQNVCNALPQQIERQQPVVFRDALNRVAPIHLEWITSHAAFFLVLEDRFKNVGLEKVRRREFALQRAGAATDIDLRTSWEACFYPGQRIDMSMIFKEQDSAGAAFCPVCKYECLGETSAEIECPICMRSFRRVIDLTEDVQGRRHNLTPPPLAPITRSKKRKSEEQEKPDEIHCFQRIRVLCKQNRSRVRGEDSGKILTCNKIWGRLQSMEKFRNGEIDVDNLCAELRSKAKCSKYGAVVDEEDVDRILGKAHVKSMDEDPLERSLSIDQRKVDSFADGSRFNTNASTEEEYVIQCFCGILEDDGNTVLCEKCGTWQHIECYYVNVLVPDRHLCKACELRLLNGKDAMHRHKRLRGSFASSNNGWNHILNTFEDSGGFAPVRSSQRADMLQLIGNRVDQAGDNVLVSQDPPILGHYFFDHYVSPKRIEDALSETKFENSPYVPKQQQYHDPMPTFEDSLMPGMLGDGQFSGDISQLSIEILFPEIFSEFTGTALLTSNSALPS